MSAPNACSSSIPDSWRDGVAGAAFPLDDTIGSWVVFGDAQTGRLDNANGRMRDSIEIIEKCEARSREAIERARAKFLGIF